MENQISDKQLAANRANAQKSTGPRTGAGKKRSALNALRHGLTAQVTIMTDADRAALEAFSKPIIAELAPVGAMETQLAQSIATFQFRINRLVAIEQNLFSLGDIEDLNSPAAFDRLSIYSQRLSTQCDRAIKQLRQMQEDRKERRNWEMSRAVDVYKYFQMTKQPFDPGKLGSFVRSTKFTPCSFNPEEFAKEYAEKAN